MTSQAVTTNENERPVVGSRGSYSVGSDRYPCTVVEVSASGHRCVVRTDRTVRGKDGRGVMFEEGGERAEKQVYTRRAHGRYVRSGGTWSYLTLGAWASYSDPGF